MEAGPRNDGFPARDAPSSRAATGLHEDTGPHGDPAVPADDGAREAGEQAPEEQHELRPRRKLRLWQIAPIVALGTLGSLMFAFPLAFEPRAGGSGAVVSMLGLLLFGCAAGWGVMAARRAGQSWPGVPARSSGRRADWRVVLLYTVVMGVVAGLAVLRVARLG